MAVVERSVSLLRHVSFVRLLAIASFAFALTLISNTLNPSLYTYKLRLFVPDDPNAALGLLRFASLIVAAVTQPIVGVLSDRTRTPLGKRLPYFIAGSGMGIVCLYGIALAPELTLFVVMVLIAQVAFNIIQGPWQALIPDQVPETQRGQAAGVRAMFDILAVVAGGQIAPYFLARADTLGMMAGVYAVSAPALGLLLALLLTAFLARENTEPAPAQGTPQSPLAVLHRAFDVDLRSYPAFRWWLLNRFLFWVGVVSLANFLINYAIDVLGMTPEGAQNYYREINIYLGISLLAAALPAGWLSDRLGRKPFIMAAGFLAALGTLPFIFSVDRSILLAGGALVGFATGGFLSTNWALATEIIPREEAARYLGIANIATAMGIGIGALVGVSIDLVNNWTNSLVTGYQVAYVLTALVYALSALVIWRMPLHKNAV
ncbi:MAG: MFS transporter [Chloroflexi bacterium]|nr:MFS transporter [Chloroflexota bacterium]